MISKIVNSWKNAIALHSSRWKMAMAGDKIQIGGDLQCREAQTQISIFSLFVSINLFFNILFLNCEGIFTTKGMF